MGLFIDGSGLPVTYDLFRGNANDSITLPQMMDQSVFQLNAGHTIYVADRGVMSGNNISRIRMQHDGYVISHTARGADKQFKEWIIRDVDTDPVNERFVHTYERMAIHLQSEVENHSPSDKDHRHARTDYRASDQ